MARITAVKLFWGSKRNKEAAAIWRALGVEGEGPTRASVEHGVRVEARAVSVHHYAVDTVGAEIPRGGGVVVDKVLKLLDDVSGYLKDREVLGRCDNRRQRCVAQIGANARGEEGVVMAEISQATPGPPSVLSRSVAMVSKVLLKRSWDVVYRLHSLNGGTAVCLELRQSG